MSRREAGVGDYELRRNELIPAAEQAANRACGLEPPRKGTGWAAWCRAWNLVFHGAMNEMAWRSGLGARPREAVNV